MAETDTAAASEASEIKVKTDSAKKSGCGNEAYGGGMFAASAGLLLLATIMLKRKKSRIGE